MSTSYLRLATVDEFTQITTIIHEAKELLYEQQVDQWQHGYPSDDDIAIDLKNGITYVLVVDNQIAGTAALHQGIDPNYLEIEDGSWINGIHGRYTVIHRIAVSSVFRGQALSDKLISGLITISGVLGYKDVRIDTHPDNKGMQHVITKNGFKRRGVIYMHVPKELRYAYQFLIK